TPYPTLPRTCHFPCSGSNDLRLYFGTYIPLHGTYLPPTSSTPHRNRLTPLLAALGPALLLTLQAFCPVLPYLPYLSCLLLLLLVASHPTPHLQIRPHPTFVLPLPLLLLSSFSSPAATRHPAPGSDQPTFSIGFGFARPPATQPASCLSATVSRRLAAPH
ncbi:hypothetical protein IWX49DRAFT_570686, partial [Phyllosticta citricarpa]